MKTPRAGFTVTTLRTVGVKRRRIYNDEHSLSVPVNMNLYLFVETVCSKHAQTRLARSPEHSKRSNSWISLSDKLGLWPPICSPFGGCHGDLWSKVSRRSTPAPRKQWERLSFLPETTPPVSQPRPTKNLTCLVVFFPSTLSICSDPNTQKQPTQDPSRGMHGTFHGRAPSTRLQLVMCIMYGIA
jgi:hypothetical protein